VGELSVDGKEPDAPRTERRAVPDQAEQLDRLTAALADRYTIERELGRGGMARSISPTT
jgi:hypothetical protein